MIHKGRFFEWKAIFTAKKDKNTVLPFYLFPRNGDFGGRGQGAGRGGKEPELPSFLNCGNIIWRLKGGPGEKRSVIQFLIKSGKIALFVLNRTGI